MSCSNILPIWRERQCHMKLNHTVHTKSTLDYLRLGIHKNAVFSVYCIKSYLTCKGLVLIWGSCCFHSSKFGSRIFCSCMSNLHNKYIWPISPSFDNSIHCLKIKHLCLNSAQLKRQEKDRGRLATYGWYLPCKYKFCLFQDLKFVNKYQICKF